MIMVPPPLEEAQVQFPVFFHMSNCSAWVSFLPYSGRRLRKPGSGGTCQSSRRADPTGPLYGMPIGVGDSVFANLHFEGELAEILPFAGFTSHH